MAAKSGKTYDVIVIGAGASGMMCAARAAEGGRAVLLLDHNDAPGRKLDVTGGGKCNFSNRLVSAADYVGENPDFCRSALSRFSPEQALDLLARAGIAVEEREHGQLFCGRSAKDLTALLVRRCREAGCGFALGVKVRAVRRLRGEGLSETDEATVSCDAPPRSGALSPAGPPLPDASLPDALLSGSVPPGAPKAPGVPVTPKAPGAVPARGPRFLLETNAGPLAARSLVIACGGPAWPQVGATGTGYELARSLGHEIIPPRPALAGFVMDAAWPLAGLAGISVTADIRLGGLDELPGGSGEPGGLDMGRRPCAGKASGPRRSGKKGRPGHVVPPDPLAAKLPLLFTHKGLSGPAALQASLYWRKGCSLVINFLPGLDIEALLNEPGQGKVLCGNLFRRFLPERLLKALLEPDLERKQAAQLSRAERRRLCESIQAFICLPLGTEPYSKAEVSAGGVSTDRISSRSLQSEIVPGLFFCGEVLDLTGRLGGYNLHWAFAGGLAAGEALALE